MNVASIKIAPGHKFVVFGTPFPLIWADRYKIWYTLTVSQKTILCMGTCGQKNEILKVSKGSLHANSSFMLAMSFNKSVNVCVCRMQQSVMNCWNQQTLRHRELHWLMMHSWRLEASHWQNSSQNLCIPLWLPERLVEQCVVTSQKRYIQIYESILLIVTLKPTMYISKQLNDIIEWWACRIQNMLICS